VVDWEWLCSYVNDMLSSDELLTTFMNIIVYYISLS
jgi:hypothetical protein